LGFKSRWGRDLPNPFRPARRPNLLDNMYGRPWRCVDKSPHSSAKIKDRGTNNSTTPCALTTYYRGNFILFGFFKFCLLLTYETHQDTEWATWRVSLTFMHRASCTLGQAFHYSPENALYIFNQ